MKIRRSREEARFYSFLGNSDKQNGGNVRVLSASLMVLYSWLSFVFRPYCNIIIHGHALLSHKDNHSLTHLGFPVTITLQLKFQVSFQVGEKHMYVQCAITITGEKNEVKLFNTLFSTYWVYEAIS